MGPEVGKVLEGRVTGITRFGAFVVLPDGKSGLVHISEIADTYVNDIHEFLEIGQTVSVLVLNVSDDGKINLSIKKASRTQNNNPPAGKRQHEERTRTPRLSQIQEKSQYSSADSAAGPNAQFEEKLKKFMQESDSRIASNPMYADHKKKNRRR